MSGSTRFESTKLGDKRTITMDKQPNQLHTSKSFDMSSDSEGECSDPAQPNHAFVEKYAYDQWNPFVKFFAGVMFLVGFVLFLLIMGIISAWLNDTIMVGLSPEDEAYEISRFCWGFLVAWIFFSLLRKFIIRYHR